MSAEVRPIESQSGSATELSWQNGGPVDLPSSSTSATEKVEKEESSLPPVISLKPAELSRAVIQERERKDGSTLSSVANRPPTRAQSASLKAGRGKEDISQSGARAGEQREASPEARGTGEGREQQTAGSEEMQPSTQLEGEGNLAPSVNPNRTPPEPGRTPLKPQRSEAPPVALTISSGPPLATFHKGEGTQEEQQEEMEGKTVEGLLDLLSAQQWEMERAVARAGDAVKSLTKSEQRGFIRGTSRVENSARPPSPPRHPKSTSTREGASFSASSSSPSYYGDLLPGPPQARTLGWKRGGGNRSSERRGDDDEESADARAAWERNVKVSVKLSIIVLYLFH